MTDELVKEQFLWMIANRPGYYVWIGWLRSLSQEHQTWVRSQLPKVRQVVAERKLALSWEGIAKWAEALNAQWVEVAQRASEAIGSIVAQWNAALSRFSPGAES
jgi:hypothetical protein